MKLLMKLILFLLPAFAFAQSKPDAINSIDQKLTPALLAAELIANDTTDRQKLNSIFRWVIANIDYNTKVFKNSNNNPSRDYRLEEDEDTISPLKPLNLRVAELVLKRRTAVCDGYARLFKILCDYAGIKCEIITGYGRTNINRIGAKFVSNHKWNAVFIDSAWQLLDATWASGYINYKDEFQREYNSHYFLSKPEEFILDHYPEDLRWALLSEPPVLKEFESTPFKTTAFNRHYISSFKPVSGIIEASVGDSITIEIETGRYKKTLWVADIQRVDSNAIFILQCCGAIKPENIINGNKLSVQYKVLTDKIEWLNIVYDDELLMRYKLNVRKDYNAK